MTPEEFGQLFDGFTDSAFRLETLPSYNVGGQEAERIAAFRAGRPRPERSVRTDPWLRRIALTSSAGKSWTRVRVLDDPPTDYEQYQLVGYQESQAAGDCIRIVARGQFPAHGPDFWLFDQSTDHAQAVVMHYTPDGVPEEFVHLTGSADVQDLTKRAVAADALAVPFNDYLAGGGAARRAS